MHIHIFTKRARLLTARPDAPLCPLGPGSPIAPAIPRCPGLPALPDDPSLPYMYMFKHTVKLRIQMIVRICSDTHSWSFSPLTSWGTRPTSNTLYQ